MSLRRTSHHCRWDSSSASVDKTWGASIFGGLDPMVQSRLRHGATEVAVPAGQAIYRSAGSPKMALVVSGLARVLISSPDGRRATIRYARPGDFTGTISVIAERQVVDSEAVTDCDVLLLHVPTVVGVARLDARVAWLMAKEAGRVCSEVIELSAATVFGTVRQRVAWHLLDLAQQDAQGLVVLADQQDIADAVGSVREVVARALKGLRDDGLVDRHQHGLRLVDPAALHSVAIGSH